MEEQKDLFDHLKLGKIDTPDATYFDQLAKNVIASQEVKVIPLYKKPIVWLSSAAAAIVILVVVNYSAPEESTDALLALNDIPTEDVLAYVDKHIEDFDVEMLSEMVPSENIEAIQLSEPIENNPITTPKTEETKINFDNIDTEDILDYINSEEIDIYDLDEFELL
jgi:hypothetical protein